MDHIDRDEAVARVVAERGDSACLICALRDGAFGPSLTLARTVDATVLLTRRALRRGHLLVIANEHVTSFSAIDLDAWLAMNRLAHRAARALEASLRPLRCYVASLGAVTSELPMTSSHLHLHVVPVSSPDDKPSTVLTWERGILVASEDEWRAIHRELLAAWDAALT